MLHVIHYLLATLLLPGCRTQDVPPEIPPGVADTYKNPVVNFSLPDPTLVKADDGYFYLYATEDIRNMPIYRSADSVNWEFVGTSVTDAPRPGCEPKGGLWPPDISMSSGK